MCPHFVYLLKYFHVQTACEVVISEYKVTEDKHVLKRKITFVSNDKVHTSVKTDSRKDEVPMIHVLEHTSVNTSRLEVTEAIRVSVLLFPNFSMFRVPVCFLSFF